MRIKNKPILIEGKQHYLLYDETEDRAYSRVEACIIFPASSPGVIVVVAEEMLRFHRDSEMPLHVLAEFEEWDMRNLLRKYMDLKADFQISDCMSPPSETSTRFLQTFNALQRKSHLQEIYPSWPPYYQQGSINYHIAILKEALRNESRRLHIPEGSTIPGYLKQIPLGQDFKDSEHPLIAGLAYQVTKFITQPYAFPNNVQSRCQTDYRPL